MIGIVDLRMGNLRSVSNAIAFLGYETKMITRAEDMTDLSHLVLPGVGSYATAMAHMREQALVDPIRAFSKTGKPMLGICLGMHLLSSIGEEGGMTEGLGLIPSRVVRFEPARVPAIPHVGWNELRLLGTHPVFHKVKSGVDFYYVHSYHLVCDYDGDRKGLVEYGGESYVAFVARDNVLGFQFHPEKSQANGVRLLENFCDWDGSC